MKSEIGEVQRVYHFVELGYGLDDLRKRRLKVAELMKLNDPFEFFGTNLKNPELRRAFRVMKEELSRKHGVLCFSRNWSNPVQWSHYADRHKGLCLGFDIPSRCLGTVNYSSSRFSIDESRLLDPKNLDQETAKKLLFTKYSHWRYEREVRCFVTLDESDPESGLYFVDFTEELKLVEVIMGAECVVPESDILNAIGDLRDTVKISKARLAFGSFNVVRQRNKKFWWSASPS